MNYAESPQYIPEISVPGKVIALSCCRKPGKCPTLRFDLKDGKMRAVTIGEDVIGVSDGEIYGGYTTLSAEHFRDLVASAKEGLFDALLGV